MRISGSQTSAALLAVLLSFTVLLMGCGSGSVSVTSSSKPVESTSSTTTTTVPLEQELRENLLKAKDVGATWHDDPSVFDANRPLLDCLIAGSSSQPNASQSSATQPNDSQPNATQSSTTQPSVLQPVASTTKDFVAGDAAATQSELAVLALLMANPQDALVVANAWTAELIKSCSAATYAVDQETLRVNPVEAQPRGDGAKGYVVEFLTPDKGQVVYTLRMDIIHTGQVVFSTLLSDSSNQLAAAASVVGASLLNVVQARIIARGASPDSTIIEFTPTDVAPIGLFGWTASTPPAYEKQMFNCMSVLANDITKKANAAISQRPPSSRSASVMTAANFVMRFSSVASASQVFSSVQNGSFERCLVPLLYPEVNNPSRLGSLPQYRERPIEGQPAQTAAWTVSWQPKLENAQTNVTVIAAQSDQTVSIIMCDPSALSDKELNNMANTIRNHLAN